MLRPKEIRLHTRPLNYATPATSSTVRSLAAAAPAVARWTNNGNNYQLR